MKTKKTPAKKSTKKSSAQSDLAMLNAVWLNVQKEYDALMRLLDTDNAEKIARQKKVSDAAFARFTQLRSKLPAVKFDAHSGEYFYAYDETGRNVFHIHIEARIAKTFAISASNAQEAIEIAKKQATIDMTGSKFYTDTIEARNVSQRA